MRVLTTSQQSNGHPVRRDIRGWWRPRQENIFCALKQYQPDDSLLIFPALISLFSFAFSTFFFLFISFGSLSLYFVAFHTLDTTMALTTSATNVSTVPGVILISHRGVCVCARARDRVLSCFVWLALQTHCAHHARSSYVLLADACVSANFVYKTFP